MDKKIKLTNEQVKCYDVLKLYFKSQAFLNFKGTFIAAQEVFNTKLIYIIHNEPTPLQFEKSREDYMKAEEKLSDEGLIKTDRGVLFYSPEKQALESPNFEQMPKDIAENADKLIRRLDPESMKLTSNDVIEALQTAYTNEDLI